MSVGESGGGNKDDVNLDAMTEDEQIAYAMRMSMQEEAGPSASGGAEKMEVDEQAADKEDYSEAMNDPAFLQVRKISVKLMCACFYLTNFFNLFFRVCLKVYQELIPNLMPFVKPLEP